MPVRRAQGALGDGLRQVEGVSAEEVDVLESKRRDAGDVGLGDLPTLAGEDFAAVA
jgi:hypothetical protein